MTPSPQRLSLLRTVPIFSALSENALLSLADSIEEVSYPPGTKIISEGDQGDAAFVILEGDAEVSAASPDGPAVLATLSAGELFGELALLSPGGTRAATVTAADPLRVISIPAAEFRRLIDEDAQARARFESASESMLTLRFLKLAASPFATLPQEQFKKLAAKLKPLSVPAGEHVGTC